MIIKISDLLEKSFWEYVSYEEIINLFIIGYVENHGFNTRFQNVWAQLDDNNKMTSVILRNHSKLIIYSYKNDFDVYELINHIDNLKINTIHGKKIVLDKLIDKYDNFILKEEKNFYTLKKLKDIDTNNTNEYKIKSASVKDTDRICNFLNILGENLTEKYIKEKKKDVSQGNNRVYFIENNDNILSTISTGIETSFLAKLVDLGIAKDGESKNSAKYLLYYISKELLEEGKIPCIFYSDDTYKDIYIEMGYEKVSDWTTLSKNKS